jgi:hypothetical protein
VIRENDCEDEGRIGMRGREEKSSEKVGRWGFERKELNSESGSERSSKR